MFGKNETNLDEIVYINFNICRKKKTYIELENMIEFECLMFGTKNFQLMVIIEMKTDIEHCDFPEKM